jgi:plasmid maintenance system antidote protein VapI
MSDHNHLTRLRAEIREAILEAMERRVVHRAELARQLGVSPSRISHMLEPGALVGVEMMARIADVLGCSWRIRLDVED